MDGYFNIWGTWKCLFGSSNRRCSIKKHVLKNLENFTGKHVCWSLFSIKLRAFRPATSLKRDSNTGVFLRILRNVLKNLFWRTSANDCICISIWFYFIVWFLWRMSIINFDQWKTFSKNYDPISVWLWVVTKLPS